MLFFFMIIENLQSVLSIFFHRKDIHLVKTYTCTKCGNTYTESIPATSHTYQSKIVKATNKKNGSIAQVCSKCGTQKGKKT